LTDDLDEIRALENRPGTRCAFARLLDSDPDLADKATRALAEGIQARAISRWLATKERRVAEDTLKRHARGECCRG
jgi:hypothetical protein